MEGSEREQEFDRNATSIMESPLAPQPSGDSDAARALEQLRFAYMDNRGDFGRVAALDQPGVGVRDAVRALLVLPPDVLSALGAVTSLPEDERRVIAAAIALPAEVQATLRAILG